jgi:hypothetical protein
LRLKLQRLRALVWVTGFSKEVLPAFLPSTEGGCQWKRPYVNGAEMPENKPKNGAWWLLVDVGG